MSRTKKTTYERKLFGGMFTDALNRFKLETGKNNDEVATMLKTSRGSIQKWCVGDNIPKQETVEMICHVFGLPEDYFDMDNATHDQLYKYSSIYMDKVAQEHVRFAKEHDLNLDLVRVLSNLIDFDNSFPLYGPISHKSMDPETGIIKYDRDVNFMSAADIDDDLHFLQINRNGRKITMSNGDLAFLKIVQDQIIQYIEFLFYKRSADMQEETRRFNDDLLVSKGTPEQPEHGYMKITKDFYYQHDNYGKYIADDYLPIVREATKKDMDSFFKKEGK